MGFFPGHSPWSGRSEWAWAQAGEKSGRRLERQESQVGVNDAGGQEKLGGQGSTGLENFLQGQDVCGSGRGEHSESRETSVCWDREGQTAPTPPLAGYTRWGSQAGVRCLPAGDGGACTCVCLGQGWDALPHTV